MKYFLRTLGFIWLLPATILVWLFYISWAWVFGLIIWKALAYSSTKTIRGNGMMPGWHVPSCMKQMVTASSSSSSASSTTRVTSWSRSGCGCSAKTSTPISTIHLRGTRGRWQVSSWTSRRRSGCTGRTTGGHGGENSGGNINYGTCPSGHNPLHLPLLREG